MIKNERELEGGEGVEGREGLQPSLSLPLFSPSYLLIKILALTLLPEKIYSN